MLDKVIALTSQFFNVNKNELSKNTTADDIEEWDSLAHASFIVFLEKELGITFELTEIMNIKDLGDLADLIEKLLKK